MSVTFTSADAAVVLAEALAIYKAQTGVTLQPADPRRLHLQTILLLLTQIRAGINFAGNENILRYVSSLNIEALAELWGEAPIAAAPSTCVVRFTFSVAGVHTVAAGKRVTDGTNIWAVVTTTSSGPGATDLDLTVRCTVTGSETNGIAIGQIDTLVDDIPGCSGVSNTTATISGRPVETTEAFRERLRSVPESRSTCGPRGAYEAAAIAASSNVADAMVLGPEDGGFLAGYAPDPGEVWILIIEGERNAAGEVISTIPEPTAGLLDAVEEACSADDVRPLTDFVTVQAPDWVDFDCTVTYYISVDRAASVVEIQEAAEDAFEAYKIWQSKIGRDINPSNLVGRLMAAGAKRVVVTDPTYTVVWRDQCSRIAYNALVYGGVEND